MAKVITYPLTDTLNDMVACDQIRQQIEGSAISVTLLEQPEGVMCGFTEVTFSFDSDLSAGDVTILDGIVAIHDGAGLMGLDTLEVVPKASLPTYAQQGWMAFVPDDASGPVPAYYDGTDWRIVTTGALVS